MPTNCLKYSFKHTEEANYFKQELQLLVTSFILTEDKDRG